MTTITSDLEQQLINDYLTSNLKTRDIIEKYKIDDIKFQNIRQKYGNPYRDPKLNKIQLNEDYFESIDTPAKAYYLGFIAGDGYLRYREKMNIYILRIELHVKDVDILEKFKKDLESEHTITLSKRFDKKFQVERESCIIEISNEKLCTDIIKNGVGMNKSKELDLPKMSDYLMRYYIRGLTDSDGSWFIRSNKEEITFSICSPIYEYLKKVQLFLIEKCELDE